MGRCPIIKVKQGKKIKYQYNNIHLYDSKEEIYVLWWLLELQEKGFVTHFEPHPQIFELIPPEKYAYEKHMKTCKKIIRIAQLFDSHDYTPDFVVYFSATAYERGYTYKLNQENSSIRMHKNRGKICISSGCAWIEVKGAYSIYNNHREFSINQKLLWNNQKIYVQKIEPLALFKHTFYPERYLWTDGLKKKRTIKKSSKIEGK